MQFKIGWGQQTIDLPVSDNKVQTTLFHHTVIEATSIVGAKSKAFRLAKDCKKMKAFIDEHRPRWKKWSAVNRLDFNRESERNIGRLKTQYIDAKPSEWIFIYIMRLP